MSTDSMFHWRHLESILRSDCRQRHRHCLESGPRFSLQCWCSVDTNAATCYHSSGENAPISTPRRAHQDRRAAPCGDSLRKSTVSLQFHERGCHTLERETGEVYCQYSNTQIQILVGLQVVVMVGKSGTRSIYRLLCVHHHIARGIKAVVVFRYGRTGGW